MQIALSIAGSDCSGGAGIQADLKTMTTNGVYAMSVITALTAQNTKEITMIEEVSPALVKAQLDAVFTDIRPDAVKIGMLGSVELIQAIAEKLSLYQPKNIVLDPVMVATSGAKLLAEESLQALKEKLFPLADLLTPNIPEAEILSGIKITTPQTMVQAGRLISESYQCAVLVKGGHNINDANDVLCHSGEALWFNAEKINNPNTHGTGCTLSSAITANLAKGYELESAITKAKSYLSGALSSMLALGAGSGPLNHAFCLTQELN